MFSRSILKRNIVKALNLSTLSVLIVALLAAAGCNSSSSADAEEAAGRERARAEAELRARVPVLVATATQKDVPIEISAVGTVEAYTTISVKSLVTGELTDFFFKEGDYVHKGDKLFTIDSRTYEAATQASGGESSEGPGAAMAQAEANLNAGYESSQQYARDTAERYQGPLKDGIVSKDQTEQLASNANASSQSVDADRAAIDSAKAQIEARPGQYRQYEGAVELLRAARHHRRPHRQRLGEEGQHRGSANYDGSPDHQPGHADLCDLLGSRGEAQRYPASTWPQGKLPVFAKPQDEAGPGETGAVTFIDNSGRHHHRHHQDQGDL